MKVPDSVSQQFLKALDSFGCTADTPVLMAVSGGVDSVSMAHLFHIAGFRFAIAHVNYRLRGEESEGDAAFVRALAETYNVPFFIYVCSDEELGNSIQQDARHIRYRFLQDTAQHEGFDFFATAHHLDDSVETALHHFARGTGIGGLGGVTPKIGKLIRPLLHCTRAEIEDYAKQHTLAYRTDSSNATDTYTRNRLRHHVIPELMKAVPQSRKGLPLTMQLLRETNLLLRDAVDAFATTHTRNTGQELHIYIEALLAHPAKNVLLHELLRSFQAPAWVVTKAMQLAQAQSGTSVVCGNLQLTQNRGTLVVAITSALPHQIQLEFDSQLPFLQHSIVPVPHTFANNLWQATFDADQLQWPLILRPWQTADSMQPLGMQGQKNISDILTDAHWPAHIRKQTLVLLSNQEIIWLPGCRMAHNVRITENTKQAVRFTFDEEYYQ